MQYDDRLFENRNDGRGAWAVRWLMRRYEGRSPWNFCWRITLEHTLIVIALAIASGLFLMAKDVLTGVSTVVEDHPLEREDPFTILLASLVFAPIFETLLLQALPIMIARKCRAGLGMQVLVSGVPFAALHFFDLWVGIVAGIPGGLYLGVAYAHWRRKSLWTALWITTVSHGLRNVLPAIAMIAA